MKKLALAQLINVRFIKHDGQLVGYRERVEAWMKQWTTKNNFKVMVLPEEDEYKAVEYWAKQHLDNVKAHFAYLIPKEFREVYNFGQDFEITYAFVPFEQGVPFWGDGNDGSQQHTVNLSALNKETA
jgi:hypothetical protein